MELLEGEYTITDDKAKLKLDEVQRLLAQSLWAKDRSIEQIAETIKNCTCFAIFHQHRLVGFARVLSDFAVYSLVFDVIIDTDYRGRGLAKKLMRSITEHPLFKNTSVVLWTKHAKGLYQKLGFVEEDCYTFLFKRP